MSEDVRPQGTYRTLDEQREVLTPAEERFERVRQTTGLIPILILLNHPEVRRISGAEEYIAEERSKLGPFSTGERNTLIAFVVAVGLWVLPGLTALIFGDESTVYAFLYRRLDEGTVAIIGAALLFILPINWAERRFTMNWNQAARIDWGPSSSSGAASRPGRSSRTPASPRLSERAWPTPLASRAWSRYRLSQPSSPSSSRRPRRTRRAPPSSCPS